MKEVKGLVYGGLLAVSLVILGISIAGNTYAQAGYTGNPYAPQTQYVCTHQPYYHCTMLQQSVPQNPYPTTYSYPYGYGVGYVAGSNVDYHHHHHHLRHGHQVHRGGAVHRGGGAIRGGGARGGGGRGR